MVDKTKIIDHMATCIFYTMHELNIPNEMLDLAGNKMRKLELNMHVFINSIKNDPLNYLKRIYKNYVDVNKRVLQFKEYMELLLLEFIRPEILKLYKQNNYVDIFKRVFSDVMLAYIIEVKKLSPTMFLSQNIESYRFKCTEIIAEKLKHYIGITLHLSIDPSIETVPLAIYEELQNEYNSLLKKHKKLKIKFKECTRN